MQRETTNTFEPGGNFSTKLYALLYYYDKQEKSLHVPLRCIPKIFAFFFHLTKKRPTEQVNATDGEKNVSYPGTTQIVVLFLGLFNDAFSVDSLIQRGMDGITTQKIRGRNWSWPTIRYSKSFHVLMLLMSKSFYLYRYCRDFHSFRCMTF